MLFSDIEGSTLLLNRLGARYADALDEQRRILRAAWTDHHGVEMGTEGDSFFVVFAAAEDAVSAAVQAQSGLAGQSWPQSEQVRVRIGIHTGSPMIHDGGYVGIDVHRAARIASAAHGGQVVVSASARALAEHHLDPRLVLLDLGEHQLKDLAHPERLYQVSVPGLPSDFPPLKSLGTASSLPRPPGRLVGRDADLEALLDLLDSASDRRDDAVRVVTLVGTGGAGKTRLAIALARRLSDEVGRFPDGVFYVGLAEATTEESTWTEIGEALDVPMGNRTREHVLDHLARRRVLLVLDNLEQIHEVGTVVARLVDDAPGVDVVATSRGPLHVAAEHVYTVAPLPVSVSDDPVAVSECAAVELFVQAAGKVRPGFHVTAENAADLVAICRHLDGLPLALELAAARTNVLGARAIAARMDRALDLTGHDHRAPRRQQTLRDAIAWSYELLDEQQQLVFRRLGVFSGGADAAAVLAVAPEVTGDAIEVLSALVDASLVGVGEGHGGEPRFWLLEMIRAFALDTLVQSGEADDIARLHARHFAQLAEELEPLMGGPRYLEVFGRFSEEHDNLRAAIAWAAEAEPSTGMRIVLAMRHFARVGGHNAEEGPQIERLLASAGSADDRLVAKCQCTLAMHYSVTDPARCQALLNSSIAMCRRLADDKQLVYSQIALADHFLDVDEVEEAAGLVDESVRQARAIGDPHLVHEAGKLLLALEGARGHFQTALEVLDEAYSATVSDGNPIDRLSSDHERAWLLRRLGRADEAVVWMRAATDVAVNLGFAWRNGLTFMAEDYAGILAELGDAAGAARLIGAVDARRELLSFPRTAQTEVDLADSLYKARRALSPEEWEHCYLIGRAEQLEDALVTAENWSGVCG